MKWFFNQMLRSIWYLIYIQILVSLAFSARDDVFMGGIQVNEPSHEHWVSCLKHHGMNTVSVTVYARQGEWNSADLITVDEKRDYWALEELKQVKSSGLKVVFIPRVALDHAFQENDELWHGMIMPDSEKKLRVWFEKYQEYLVRWAKIAEKEKVDLFAIGSELKELTKTLEKKDFELKEELSDFQVWYRSHEERLKSVVGGEDDSGVDFERVRARSEAYLRWADQVYFFEKGEEKWELIKKRRQLLAILWSETIAKVRLEYSGKLTYAANFDTYQNNGLWRELDVMGINAYFKLREDFSAFDKEELQEILDQSWSRIFGDIKEFQIKLGVPETPLIFTELGYTSRKNCSIEPWSYDGVSMVEYKEETRLLNWRDQPKNYQERLQCLLALSRVVNQLENRFFKGLLYWKLSTIKSHEEIEAFTLHIGKNSSDPSLEVLAKMLSKE